MYWTFDPWKAVLWGYFWTFVERGLVEGIKPLGLCPFRRVGQRSRLLSSLLPGCHVVSSFASPHCSTVPEWAGWAYMASNLWKHEPKQRAPQWQAANNEHSHDSLNCVCSCPSVFCLILSEARGCCQPGSQENEFLPHSFGSPCTYMRLAGSDFSRGRLFTVPGSRPAERMFLKSLLSWMVASGLQIHRFVLRVGSPARDPISDKPLQPWELMKTEGHTWRPLRDAGATLAFLDSFHVTLKFGVYLSVCLVYWCISKEVSDMRSSICCCPCWEDWSINHSAIPQNWRL